MGQQEQKQQELAVTLSGLQVPPTHGLPSSCPALHPLSCSAHQGVLMLVLGTTLLGDALKMSSIEFDFNLASLKQPFSRFVRIMSVG